MEGFHRHPLIGLFHSEREKDKPTVKDRSERRSKAWLGMVTARSGNGARKYPVGPSTWTRNWMNFIKFNVCQKNKKECTHEAMTSASLFANPFNVGQISSISVNHLRPPYSLRFARPSRTTI
jgi:hypothetical protein